MKKLVKFVRNAVDFLFNDEIGDRISEQREKDTLNAYKYYSQIFG